MFKRSTSELVLLTVSAFAVITVSPFIVLRYLAGDFTMVLLDLGIVVAMLLFFVFIYKTRNVELAKLIFAILITCVIVLIIIIIIRGDSHIYWIYPCLIATYYILPEKVAASICTVAIAVILGLIYASTELIHFLTIMMTLFLTSFLSYAIFSNYNATNKKLALLATVDPLTLSGNRRALSDTLMKEIRAYRREPTSMCLMLMDLDYFKKVNDSYGHAIGDQILVDFVQLVNDHTRALDLVFRYGGEEFIVAPLKMDIKKAECMAENLRKLIEKHNFSDDAEVTVSIGLTEYQTDETIESWIARADAALYQAKEQGRNQVIVKPIN